MAELTFSANGAKASGVGAFTRFAALVGVQYPLAHAEGDWRHLDQLIGLDEIERLLEAQFDRRREPHGDVRGGRADVALLLLFGDGEGHVLGTRVHADDHAFVPNALRLDAWLRRLPRCGPR